MEKVKNYDKTRRVRVKIMVAKTRGKWKRIIIIKIIKIFICHQKNTSTVMLGTGD